jgi:hypothetical protein
MSGKQGGGESLTGNFRGQNQAMRTIRRWPLPKEIGRRFQGQKHVLRSSWKLDFAPTNCC